jgi:membrane-associated HD superfamily phosphohydrolase
MGITIIGKLICLINCHNYQLKRLGILTLQYYRLLVLYNVAFTILALLLLVFNAATVNTPIFLFAKIIGFISAVSLHHFSVKENYFYFRNTGFGMKRMIINAFIIDTALCVLLIILSKIIFYAATCIKG